MSDQAIFPMPTVRTLGSESTQHLATLIWVILLTIITTFGINYAVVRFSLIPAPTKLAAGKLVAGPVKPKVGRVPAAPATAGVDAEAMRQFSDRATAVLSLIDEVRTNAGPSFVSPAAHPGLDTNFNRLTLAANNVLRASGDNPQWPTGVLPSGALVHGAGVNNVLTAQQEAVAEFTRALDTTIRNATQISQRPGSPDTVQNATQVASALSDIRAALP
jgi:hypothetical protein